MNLKLRDIFRGKVVNKAHTINTGVDESPRYVLEYLMDNYCSEETFREKMEKVVRRLKESCVNGADAERIRHYIWENRQHTIIASLEAQLVETEGRYWGSISAIDEQFVNIPERIATQYPMLLAGGCGERLSSPSPGPETQSRLLRVTSRLRSDRVSPRTDAVDPGRSRTARPSPEPRPRAG